MKQPHPNSFDKNVLLLLLCCKDDGYGGRSEELIFVSLIIKYICFIRSSCIHRASWLAPTVRDVCRMHASCATFGCGETQPWFRNDGGDGSCSNGGEGSFGMVGM